MLQVRRRQCPYEGTRLGQIRLRGLPGGADVRGGRGVPGQRALGRAQQELDAGQALGERVVDLPGEAFALGERARRTFRLGQLGGGPVPFVLDAATVLGPAVIMIALGAFGAALSIRRITAVDPLIALGSAR
ncbi:hypothetical protein SMICM304S_08315 [Streptomyces microflavus]